MELRRLIETVLEEFERVESQEAHILYAGAEAALARAHGEITETLVASIKKSEIAFKKATWNLKLARDARHKMQTDANTEAYVAAMVRVANLIYRVRNAGSRYPRRSLRRRR